MQTPISSDVATVLRSVIDAFGPDSPTVETLECLLSLPPDTESTTYHELRERFGGSVQDRIGPMVALSAPRFALLRMLYRIEDEHGRHTLSEQQTLDYLEGRGLQHPVTGYLIVGYPDDRIRVFFELTDKLRMVRKEMRRAIARVVVDPDMPPNTIVLTDGRNSIKAEVAPSEEPSL
jgi:hypothetical protein